MEFPLWLKLESIIKNLSLSNWFNGWFRYENKKKVKKEINIKKIEKLEINYNVILSIDPDEDLEKIDPEVPPSQVVAAQEIIIKEFEFSYEEKFLIIKVNKIHLVCGCHGFNFEKNFRQALNHIRNRPSDDWYECAAKDLVLVKENIDFFSAFEEVIDPEKKQFFEVIKEDINYLYDIIQKIKHSNKRGNVQKEFLGPYNKRFDNNVMTDDKYEDIFNRFQKKLIELFKNFKLKDE